jgi:Domain of unknown function (DUF4276)
MRIGIIVEGHGEVEALPILVRRVLARQGIADVEIPRPFRMPKGKMLKQDELARAVEMMARKTAPSGALLILLDADDDCPAELGQRILERVEEARRDRPLSVVVANREFEAWFLGAAESLRGQRGLPSDLAAPKSPEDVRDAKGWLDSRMVRGYSETLDQPALASMFDLDAAERLPSFAKLKRDLIRISTTRP